jgi:hypothetical protein
MKINKSILSLAVIALVVLSSCNLTRGSSDDGTTGDPVADQLTIIAIAVQQTQTAAGPASPTFTFTPSLTPTITLTSTPDVTRLTVSVETNCRTGPGVPYDIVAVLPIGVPAEVVGKNASGDTWIIKLPSNPAVTCWLWGQFATVVGDTSSLTIYNPPPTPTPAAGFTIAYRNIVNCMGWFGFRFELINNGSVTWESYLLTITDTSTSTTKSYSADEFVDSTSTCTSTTVLKDLTPGEAGSTGNWAGGLFNYSPVGNNFTATFKLCSQNALAGTCLEKSITFIP